jgi:transketolase
VAVRVVSMPSTTVFDAQDVAYQSVVLPHGVARVALEMGVTGGWWKYGCADVIGIDRFGESAPATQLFAYFGFTASQVADRVERVLSSR